MTSRVLKAALALVPAAAMLAGAPAASATTAQGSAAPTAATAHRHHTTVFTLRPSTHGNPEGIAWDRSTQAFFVGATGDGTIYRGTFHQRTLRPYIAGHTGGSAVGMKVWHGRLYVAGGATGTVTVYDIRTRAVVASFETGAGGFLNDLVVTRHGDVYVTDSFRPTLWHVTGAQVRSGGGTPEGIGVAPEIAYQAGAFNLNGIVALHGGRVLVVVDTATGQLFRIRPGTASSPRTISLIHAPALVGGDGMVLDHGRLVVVVGDPAALHILWLDVARLRARQVAVLTNRTLRGPSTVARAHHRYLVVNADFATSRTPFTVSSIPRPLFS